MLAEGLDPIGVEPGPMCSGGIVNDDGGLSVAERLSLLQCCTVLSHIDNSVFDSLGVKRPVGSGALDTERLREDSNQNDSL